MVSAKSIQPIRLGEEFPLMATPVAESPAALVASSRCRSEQVSFDEDQMCCPERCAACKKRGASEVLVAPSGSMQTPLNESTQLPDSDSSLHFQRHS